MWIIFDAADTLLKANPSVATVYAQVAAAHGVSADSAQINLRFGPAIRKHFADEDSNEELDRTRWQDLVFDVLQTDNTHLFDDLWNHFALPSSWELYDDVGPTWTRLLDLGFQIAIASNFDARLLNIVQAKPVLSRASHVFISSQLGFRKPSTKFYDEIQRQLGCNKKELVMVGDSEAADFQGALEAGWQAFHLVRDESHATLPRISSLSALVSVLA